MEDKDKILVDYLDKYRDLAFSKSKGLAMLRGSNLTVEDIILIHVKRVTFEGEAPRKEAIENVLSSMRLRGVNFLYIIRGCKDHVEFYYGIVRNTIIKGSVNGEDNIKESILKKSIEGNFRGSDVELVDKQKTYVILGELQNKRFVSCIDGVPGINKDEAANFQGVDRLVDTMLGEDFLFVVSAFYLNQRIIDTLKTKVCSFYDQMTPLAKNTEQRGSSEGCSKSSGKTIGTNESKSSSDSKSSSKGITKSTATSETKSNSNIQKSGAEGSSNSDSSSHTEQQSSGFSKSESNTEGTNTGKSTTFSFERSKKNVQDWMAYAEDFLLKRLDYGQGKGLFMTNISLFADNKLTLKRLENTATALFSGEAGNKTPLIVNEDLKEIYLDNVRKLQIPKVRFNKAMTEKEVAVRTALSQYVASKNGETMGYWGTWMSVNELGIIAGLPRKEVVGLSLNEEVDFGLNYDSNSIAASDRLELGKLVQSGIVKNVPIYLDKNGRTRQTLWSAVQMLTQKLCCQTIHDCPKVVPLHYESE